MKLDIPLYQLKRRAAELAREQHIPRHEALNRIARSRGFRSWSLLAARFAATSAVRGLLAQFAAGDLVLLAARPGHGKTLLSLELAATAARQGTHCHFFTLEYTKMDVMEQFRSIGIDPGHLEGRFHFDGSDSISAEYISAALDDVPRGSVVIVDYLQLLDQRRTNPDLSSQVERLKTIASQRGFVMLVISQVDRTFDSARRAFPDLADVRLPNPLDLSVFAKACFLNKGQVQLKVLN